VTSLMQLTLQVLGLDLEPLEAVLMGASKRMTYSQVGSQTGEGAPTPQERWCLRGQSDNLGGLPPSRHLEEVAKLEEKSSEQSQRRKHHIGQSGTRKLKQQLQQLLLLWQILSRRALQGRVRCR
jgi:hypothetical protein